MDVGVDNKSITFIEGFKNGAAVKERIHNHMAIHLYNEFPEAFEIKKLDFLKKKKYSFRKTVMFFLIVKN